MARISDALIEEVLQKTDIVDLVSEKVTLSKQGKSYFGLCPFHHEKTASFSVEPERGIYNCFSCGEKGNAITFKQKTENITFVEAIEDLAIRAHIDFDFTGIVKEDPNAKLYAINQDAKNFYKLYLSNTKTGLVAKEYLNKRDISDDIISKFELGLAPAEFDLLHKTLTDKDILVTDLFDLGLVKQSSNDRFYDLFRDRIIFPIHNEKGNVVAFSGRTYKDDDDTAKYINSPQSKVFTKSNVLYNIHNALIETKRIDRITLFEGYMDVIAAYKAGILDGVASMGTSLTKEQVKLIKRHTMNVTICYDGDNAGIEATLRAIKLFEQEQMVVKVVTLPERLDPDDYLKKYGKDALNDFISHKWTDTLEYTYLTQQKTIDFSKMLDIEQYKKIVFELIKTSPNSVIETYIKRLSKDVKISEESIRQDFNQYAKRDVKSIRKQYTQKVNIESKYEYAERRLVNYFLLDYKYLQRYRSKTGPVLSIKPILFEINQLIEDLYKDTEHLEQPVDIMDLFLSKLNEGQKEFYFEKCVQRGLDLIDQEFEDLVEVMVNYTAELKLQRDDENIMNSESDEEKIRLALYRDLKIKEDKHGQR